MTAMRESYVVGQFVSHERKEKVKRINSALMEILPLLEKHEVTLPDLYREYVHQVRNHRVVVYGHSSSEEHNGEE